MPNSKAVFTFGRMSPPTVGHKLLVDKILSVAQKEKADPYIYLSKTEDKKKNPLSFNEKLRFFKIFFPKAIKALSPDKTIKTPVDAIMDLVEKGYEDVIMLVGDDRKEEFQNLFNQYNKHPDPEKRIGLRSIVVQSVGARDPDSDDISGVSASKMRKAAADGDFELFLQGIPSHVQKSQAKELYDLVRTKMNINTKDNLGEQQMNGDSPEEKRWKSFKQWWMTIAEEEHESGDYLVVDKDGKGHLPVKRHGKPDHGLMGAAHAALFHTHRGKPYQGPNKAAAISKLRALYKREGMDFPE